jgi:homoserine/homoserine lactone efflux protein
MSVMTCGIGFDGAGTEEFSSPGEHMPVGGAEHAVIAHLDESGGQHVLQKPTNKLFSRQRTGFDLKGGVCMSIEAWLLFVATETVLCLSPGPAVLLVLSVSLTRGWHSGLQASTGILVANLFYFFLSATSLGAILLASWELFFLIKWLGAGYLIWLGLQTFFTRREAAHHAAEHPAPIRTGMGTFLHGVVAQGANPKALVFFTALLPQFVDPAKPLATQILILAVTSVLIEFGVLAGYAVLASRASGLAHRPRVASILHRLGGGLLIGAGAGLAMLKRH